MEKYILPLSLHRIPPPLSLADRVEALIYRWLNNPLHQSDSSPPRVQSYDLIDLSAKDYTATAMKHVESFGSRPVHD